MPIDVYGLGQCSIDYIGTIDSFPPPDVKCEFSNLMIHGGGPVATALVALARWGIPCYFAGMRGDDDFGGMIERSLFEEGINTEGMVVRRGGDSQFAFIVAEPSVARRTIFWRRPIGTTIQPEELDKEVIAGSKIIHTDGLFTEASILACKTAKDAGVRVVVDAGTLREGMLDIAKLSDYFIASQSFARSLVEGDDPVEACRILGEMGPSVTAVTLGHGGYVALAEGALIRKSAYRVDAVDTTGCGDVFHGGFIYGLLQGWSYEKCFDCAAWSAARVSLQQGGRAGIPTLKELKNRGYGDS